MILPVVLLGALGLLHAAVLGADQVAAQSLAAQLARTAAVAGPDAARRIVADVAPAPAALDVRTVRRHGDDARWHLVEVRLRSRAFRRLGLDREVIGRAAARAQ